MNKGTTKTVVLIDGGYLDKQIKSLDKQSHISVGIVKKLLNKIQEVGFVYDGIILNAAAYTHTSVGIGDAVKAIATPVVEVHISNTFAREEFRHHSFIAPHAKGIVIGFGLNSYRLALQSFNM